MVSKTYVVFVYGSLKKGFHNHQLLSGNDATFLGEAESTAPAYAMLDLGSFPGLIEGDQRVKGELYEVNQYTMDNLDALEGHPYMYERKLARFKMEGHKIKEAWVYMYKANRTRTTMQECFWSPQTRLYSP